MKRDTWEVIGDVAVVIIILAALVGIVVSIVRDPDGNDGLQDLWAPIDSPTVETDSVPADTTFEGLDDTLFVEGDTALLDSVIPKGLR